MSYKEKENHNKKKNDNDNNNNGNENENKSRNTRGLPPSMLKLREYRMGHLPSASHDSDESFKQQQSLQGAANVTGKTQYAAKPPVYIGNLTRKELDRKSRITTAIMGIALGGFAAGLYGYVIWKRVSNGINDEELRRLEKEALAMVESGEINLAEAHKNATPH